MTVHLPFPEGTRDATFLRREKRFLVEVEADGERFWIHTNNSGSMMGLLRPGMKILMAPGKNPKRKLPYTLVALNLHGSWVSVDTLAPNRMLAVAWKEGLIPELQGMDSMKSEAKVGNSRLDARYDCADAPEKTIWVEAKNVTMEEYGRAAFPDAVTTRGQKHLQELTRLAREGVRVATFYMISRADSTCFGPAEFIDPEYARLFAEAREAGVMSWPHMTYVSKEGIRLGERLPVVLCG